MNQRIFSLFLILLTTACVAEGPPPGQASPQNTAEAPKPVGARSETDPTRVDGANDAAILLASEDLAGSRILGTAAAGGIEIYDLSGRRTGGLEGVSISLVDVAYQFPLGKEPQTLVVAYETALSEIRTYTFDASTQTLAPRNAQTILIEAEMEGLCLYPSPLTGKFYAFAVGAGAIQQWELSGGSGSVRARLVRIVPVGTGAAHCVADPRNSALFYAQETVGVWRLNAEPESESEPMPVELVRPWGRIAGDTKGLALVAGEGGLGHLLVSDADESRFHAYQATSLEYAGTFAVVGSGAVDGVQETEGLTGVGLELSADYPGGLVVFSDDDNDGEHSNYKLVAWADIGGALGLDTGAGYNPNQPMAQAAVTVTPSVETDPVTSFGDAADDPAIWVHPDNPGLSLVIGTQKQEGLNVYGMDGRLLQSLPDGRMNNADVRYGFPLAGAAVDIVAASNRTADSIAIYRIDAEQRRLVDVADGIIPTGMMDPYGLCLYQSRQDAQTYVFVNDTDGLVRQWRLQESTPGRVGAELVRSFQLETQTEGCVADDETGDLYLGEEDVGIWKYRAEPDAGDERVMVDSVEGGNLTDDVEGLSLYLGPDGQGYLLASNQGADNYAVYERHGENAFLGHFHIVADDETGIDGSSETDGLEVTSASLGPAFPHGALVVQDGRNITPAERQNFKYVPWERIAEALNLEVYSDMDPRAGSR